MLCPVTGVTVGYPRHLPAALVEKSFQVPTGVAATADVLLSSRPLGGISENRFQLEEFFKPGLSPFSTVARLLVASKTTREVDACTIHVDVAGSKALCHLDGPLLVS
jgi:hypothetical protein